MSASIQVPESVMRDFVAKAIFETLPQEKRDGLIKAALAHLLSPKRDGYGRGETSELQEVFNLSIRNAAIDICREKIEKDATLRTMLDEMITKALRLAFDVKTDEVVKATANAIAQSILNR